MLTVKLISDIEELKQIEKKWDALIDPNRHSIFSAFDMVIAWWDAFGDSKELFVLLVENEGQVVGIAPLMISKMKVSDFFVKKIDFIGSGYFDYADFIYADQGEIIADCIWDYLQTHKHKWDVIELDEMRQGSESMAVFQYPGRKEYKLIFEAQIENVCPYIKLYGYDENAFIGALKKGMRTDLRRQNKRLEALGKLEFNLNIPRKNIVSFLGMFYKLHNRRWEIVRQIGKFNYSQPRKFFTLMAEKLSDKGWLRASAVYLNGSMLAAHFGFVFGSKYYYYVPTFDPEYANYSPGKVLLFNLIKAAIGEGLSEFDFLRGDESYKALWPVEIRKNYRVLIFKKNLFGKFLALWFTKIRPFLKRWDLVKKIQSKL